MAVADRSFAISRSLKDLSWPPFALLQDYHIALRIASQYCSSASSRVGASESTCSGGLNKEGLAAQSATGT